MKGKRVRVRGVGERGECGRTGGEREWVTLHSIGSLPFPFWQHAPVRLPLREVHAEHAPALPPHAFQHPPSRLQPLHRAASARTIDMKG